MIDEFRHTEFLPSFDLKNIPDICPHSSIEVNAEEQYYTTEYCLDCGRLDRVVK